MRRIITLTTDFGASSTYVAAMKGVILSINPAAVIVDVSHGVEPQNIRQGALTLADATGWFPEHSIHVAVIDPGVGTARRIVYAEINKQHYVAPDNGLLSILVERHTPARVFAVENPQYWLPAVSLTFHGRDIMAPVAARLSMGLVPAKLGPPVDRLESIPWPAPAKGADSITGWIISVDSFGNLISNIEGELLLGLPAETLKRIRCGNREIRGIVRTYGERPAGSLAALVGSSGRLEVAVVGGNAAAELKVGIDELVEVSWGPVQESIAS